MTDDGAVDVLVKRLLTGNRRAAGRIISLLEDQSESAEAIVGAVFPHSGRAYVVGVTGPPGAGKSTVVDELIRAIRGSGKTVGVIAVDPNSPFSGGAILGDRIRMMRHSADEGVFIRSMGARGHLGGVALATWNVIITLDAMGMDVIIVETVGVGQSELEIVGSTDTTIVVIPPGLGDGVQAIKAGIMEIADIFVVNKADHPHVERTVADIRELLRMEPRPRNWVPPIVQTVATRNEGIDDLWTRTEQHRQYLDRSGELQTRRRHRLQDEVMKIAERRLRRAVLEPRADGPEFAEVLREVESRRIDPYRAAGRLLRPLVEGAPTASRAAQT